MTSPSFTQQIGAGGMRYAAVWHVGGMPWACTTDPDLVTALANTADADVIEFRKELFGRCQSIIGGTTRAAAIDVQIVPTLSLDLGSLSYSYDETKGVTGGGYTVSIARAPSGLMYPYRTSGTTPSGRYSGLDVREEYHRDPTILHAFLAKNYDGTTVGDGLTYGGETAAALHAQININSAVPIPTYLWFGSACVAARDGADNGDGTYTCSVYPGAFRAATAGVVVYDEDDFGSCIAEVPTSGIVGRPANLWLVAMRDGTIQDIADPDVKPILWANGSVTNNPQGNAGEWKIQVKGWLDWLDVEIPAPPELSGEIKGYRFCRYDSTPYDDWWDGYNYAQMPHIFVKHVQGGTLTTYFDIWLWDTSDTEIGEGESIEYDDADTLSECALRALNAGTGYQFTGQPGVLKILNCPADDYFAITGPVAWVLGWGNPFADFSEYNIMSYYTGWGGWQCLGHEENGLDRAWRLVVGSDTPPVIPAVYMPYVAAYFYQFDWTNQEALEYGWDQDTATAKHSPSNRITLAGSGIGWPYTKAVGSDLAAPAPDDYRIRLKDSISGTSFEDGTYVRLGDGLIQTTFPGTAKASKILVDTTGDNYILQDFSAGTDQWGTDSGKPILRPIPGLMDDIGNDTGEGFLWGMDLVYWPDIQPFDPWRVHFNGEDSSESLSELFQSMLGVSTDVYMTQQAKVTWVPDLGRSTALGFKTLIDWDTLDDMSATAYDPVSWKLPPKKSNIRGLLNAACQHLGIRPLIEYSNDQKSRWMTFARLGVVDAALAQLNGRYLNDNDIIDVDPVDEHGGTWLASTVELKTDYGTDKAMLEVVIGNRTGLAEAVGGDETFKIDDKMTQIKKYQYDEATSKMRDLVYRLAVPEPNVTLRVAPSAWLRIGCGSDLLLTHSNVRDPFDGSLGVESYPGIITKLQFRIGESDAGASVTVRLTPYAEMGISPSMIIEDSWQSLTATTLTVTGADTDPADNHFAKDSTGLTDLSTFGCFHYDPAEGAIAANDCGCTRGFRVTLFKQHDSVHYSSGAGAQSVWTGTVIGASGTVATDKMTLANVNAGTFKVLLDNATNFPTAPYVDMIMIFADRDASNIQPCQLVYGWFADPDDGSLEDSDAAAALVMYVS